MVASYSPSNTHMAEGHDAPGLVSLAFGETVVAAAVGTDWLAWALV
jgi:hypothetical protein